MCVTQRPSMALGRARVGRVVVHRHRVSFSEETKKDFKKKIKTVHEERAKKERKAK